MNLYVAYTVSIYLVQDFKPLNSGHRERLVKPRPHVPNARCGTESRGFVRLTGLSRFLQLLFYEYGHEYYVDVSLGL